MTTRLFFASDIHGSDICWKKFLKASERFKASVLIMGGDITGKLIIPISKRTDGFRYTLYNKTNTVKDEHELNETMARISNHGFYPFVAPEEEVERIGSDEEKTKALFDKLIVERMQQWMSQADETLKDNGFKVFVSPGNDDSFAIDNVIKKSQLVTYCDQNIVKIDDEHEMITLSWVNETPWKTPRETTEDQLGRMLDQLFAGAADRGKLVCNIHAPPYQSRLDFAPKLDENLGVVVRPGGAELIPVGSKAVREAIDKYQPLLGLHGHIHESPGFKKIGRTLCLNPGSEYNEGLLHGYVVDIDGDSVKDYFRVQM